jgi:hypothetical protein
LKGKSTKILGQIVWANKQGFGLKFKKICWFSDKYKKSNLAF